MLEPLFQFKSLTELMSHFPEEKSCIAHLEKVRWGGFPVSPYDPNSKVYKCRARKFGYLCKNTNKYFNVKTGTLFENTKLPLRLWFLAIYMVIGDKKGRSSHQLARDLNITQKTAWFLLQRIRYVFKHPGFKVVLKGE